MTLTDIAISRAPMELKITKPRKSVRYNLDSQYGTSRRPALFHVVLVIHYAYFADIFPIFVYYGLSKTMHR